MRHLQADHLCVCRKRVNSNASLQFAHDVIIEPLQDDLTENIWMYERYLCDGSPTHNPFYHEYPEVVAMMIFEVKWGIRIGFETITIKPSTSEPFVFSAGTTSVSYSSSQVTVAIALPTTHIGFEVHGLEPGLYSINSQTSVKVPSNGVLSFSANPAHVNVVKVAS